MTMKKQNEVQSKPIMEVTSIEFCKNFCPKYPNCGNIRQDRTDIVAECIWDAEEVSKVFTPRTNQ